MSTDFSAHRAAPKYHRILLHATLAWWCLSIAWLVVDIASRASYFFVVVACPIGLLLLASATLSSLAQWYTNLQSLRK